MNDASLHDMQAFLGHSAPTMTQRYAHLALVPIPGSRVGLGQPICSRNKFLKVDSSAGISFSHAGSLGFEHVGFFH